MIAGAVILCGADCFIMVNCMKEQRSDRSGAGKVRSLWGAYSQDHRIRLVESGGEYYTLRHRSCGRWLWEVIEPNKSKPSQIIDPASTDVHHPLGLLGLPGLPGVERTGRFRSPAWRG